MIIQESSLQISAIYIVKEVLNLQLFKKCNRERQNNTNKWTQQYNIIRMNIHRMENRCVISNDDKKT